MDKDYVLDAIEEALDLLPEEHWTCHALAVAEGTYPAYGPVTQLYQDTMLGGSDGPWRSVIDAAHVAAAARAAGVDKLEFRRLMLAVFHSYVEEML